MKFITCLLICQTRHQSLNMQIAEEQGNSLHLTVDTPALRPVDAKEQDFGKNYTTTSTTPQECRGYNVFRGINTSGSYHVYGDLQSPTWKMEGSHKISTLPRGGALSKKQCSQVPSINMPHESTTIISHLVHSHPNFPTTIIRSSEAHQILQGPAAPMEEDSIPHQQTGYLRLSPGFNKGVICSPQSPLRSDCQPNSPTESSSSRNATLSLKQPSDCPKEATVRNWKKYKFIVMNQTPQREEKDAARGNTEAGSPSLSPYRSDQAGGHGELQVEEEACEHSVENPRTFSSHRRCSSCGCDSPQQLETGHLSPDSYSRDDGNKLHSSSCGKFTPPKSYSIFNYCKWWYSSKPKRCLYISILSPFLSRKYLLLQRLWLQIHRGSFTEGPHSPGPQRQAIQVWLLPGCFPLQGQPGQPQDCSHRW